MPDGYTHDPERFDDDSSGGAATSIDPEQDSTTDGRVSDSAGVQGANPAAAERTFDWRGWTLVGAVFVAFLLVPGIIYLYPRVPTTFGLSFWDTYLVLPLLPAVVLGLLAVWATTRP